MSYTHPLNYYRMIGGSRDGEPYDGEPSSPLVLMKRTRLISVTEVTANPLLPPSPVDLETYTLRRFRAGAQEVRCYVIADMSDFDAQLALLRGYHPNVRRPSHCAG